MSDQETPCRVWDPELGALRDLAEDEWELESHWAGALEVHGEKMPGHSWVIVVPKYKLDAALAALSTIADEFSGPAADVARAAVQGPSSGITRQG